MSDRGLGSVYVHRPAVAGLRLLSLLVVLVDLVVVHCVVGDAQGFSRGGLRSLKVLRQCKLRDSARVISAIVLLRILLFAFLGHFFNYFSGPFASNLSAWGKPMLGSQF